MQAVRRSVLALTIIAVAFLSTSCITHITGWWWTKAHPEAAKYHTYDEIVADLKNLAETHPEIAQLHVIGKTFEGRDILALSVCVKDPQRTAPKPDVLIIGGQHANEWIGKEVVLYLADRLVNESETDPYSKVILSLANVWLVPCANPDGAVYSEKVDRQWRKSRRPFGGNNYGFDINRGYPYMWRLPGKDHWNPPTTGGSDDPSSKEFRGYPDYDDPNRPARINNEVLAILSLVSDPQRNFVLFLDYHAFSEVVLYPPAFSTDPCPDDAEYKELASGMANMINSTSNFAPRRRDLDEPKGPLKYRAKNAGSLYPDVVTGSSMDTMYYMYGIWALGIELPPYSGGFVRLGELYLSGKGFLLPAGRIKSVCIENAAGVYWAIAWAVFHQPPSTRATAPRPVYKFDRSPANPMPAEGSGLKMSMN